MAAEETVTNLGRLRDLVYKRGGARHFTAVVFFCEDDMEVSITRADAKELYRRLEINRPRFRVTYNPVSRTLSFN